MNWNYLTSSEELHKALKASNSDAIVLFKHSTRCPTSSMALRLTESTWCLPANIQAYFLDLIAHRDISGEIEHVLGVKHESPQMILVRNRKAVHHASHHQIDPTHLLSYL
ncbi:MAG: bacillithiol system redox-active protein YtxJ [Flavobacteriales bacterium]